MTAVTPDCTKVSIPSTKGKKASEAARISPSIFELNFFNLLIAILQLSNLLGCPEPIPTVDLSLVKTIAFDLTNLQILNAKIKFFKVLEFGFNFETTLKFFEENFKLSAVCKRRVLKLLL